MEIKRSIYNKIADWKNEAKGTKALLNKSYILIDFNKAGKNVKEAFDSLENLDVFFQTLTLEYNTRLYPRESLIIFDEIQKFPKAREAIKYLVADGRYDYIETGSLISIKENVQNITIPSEERKLQMYPVNFEEFMVYMSEEILLDYIRECFEKGQPLDRQMHNKAMRLFMEYMLVGGMPQALVAYKKNDRDFHAADVEKRDILSLYEDDIKKSAKRYQSKVSAIFDNIPGFLSTHEKRVVLSKVDKKGSFDRYDEPLFWLGDSMICNLCYKCNDPNVGLALNKNDSYVKCYMGDTGLLVSHAFSENEITDEQLYKQIMDGKLSLNQGMLYENLISQIITASGRKLYFYTRYSEEKHRNDIEIDFIISNESKTKFKITPIEVKSSKNYTTTSLSTFKEIFKKRIDKQIIIHPKNYSEADGVIKIPPYMMYLI